MDTEHPSLAWKATGVEYDQGPDQILPSEAISTWISDGATRIIDPDPSGKYPPLSVPSMLSSRASTNPDVIALAVKRDGAWKKWTYKAYLDDVRAAAKGFIALGLEPFHSVGILGSNSPEWLISGLAAIFGGGFSTGIYVTSSPDAVAFVASDSRANIFVVEDEKQLAKVLPSRKSLPDLKAIIQYEGEPTEDGVLSWEGLLKLGREQPDEDLEDRLRKMAINQCCTLIYTSGTTGNPKGVMLSHDNLTWTSRVTAHHLDFKPPGIEQYISFLPLSHAAAQMADIFCPIAAGATIYFGDKNILKGSLIEIMRELQPTRFLAVPRIWEKMYEKMMEIAAGISGVKRAIGLWAKGQGLDVAMRRMHGISNPESIGFKIADALVLSKIRSALGLGRCELNYSGAAPISPSILTYFWSLNILVHEVYGMTECTGPCCGGTNTVFRLGSVGQPLPGCGVRITDPDPENGNSGEICMFGRNVSMGYLGQEVKTLKSIDEDGWLHSEDLGRFDEDGFLWVTGRIKELLVTSGGENVAPVPLEANVKAALPIISQSLVVGDRKKFLSILLTLKTEVDKDTQEPMEKLGPIVKKWFLEVGGCHVETVSEALAEINKNANEKVKNAIQAGIDAANFKAPSEVQKVKKWAFLPRDFSLPGGELTPTLKLKREIICERYKSIIEEIYNSNLQN